MAVLITTTATATIKIGISISVLIELEAPVIRGFFYGRTRSGEVYVFELELPLAKLE